MSVLSLDCETSGLVIRDRPLADPAQPRIVELGFVVDDAARRRVHTYSTLIRPHGWEITPEAEAVHGITTADCSRWGVEPKVALLNLVAALQCVRTVVAHNIAFEGGMVQRELNLAAASDSGMMRPRLRRVCTMKSGATLIPDGKFPRLDRLYTLLTGLEHDGSHRALADAEATMDCFWGLVDRRIIEM